MTRALLAAAFGAACVVLAFPTFGLAVPVLVAWAPLLAVSRDLPWRRRLLAGWALGFLYNAVIFRWIVFTMQEMSSLPLAAALACLVLFAAWHGLMSGAFLALAGPVRRAAAARAPALAPLAVAALFVSVEWLWPFLFPWTLGHAFWRVGPLASVMALAGPAGLSFLVMAVSAGLADAWTERRPRPLLAAAGAAALLGGFGLAWHAHVHATPPDRVLRVAVLQMSYSLEDKKAGTLPVRARLLERLLDTLRGLPPDTFDLVVGSEGAYPLHWALDEVRAAPAAGPREGLSLRATRRVMAAVAEGPRADTVLGGLRRPPGSKVRNAAVHLAPDGHVAGVYDKVVLVPFGEYLPGTSLFPSLAHSIPGISDFAAGDAPCRLRLAGVPAACGICYESIFSGFTREAAGDDARLLVNMTIDVWFGRSTAPWFHLMVQSSRAAELGVPLVRAALTGISAVVDADGVPLATLPLDEAGVLEAAVPLRPLRTPFRAVGPLFAWLCLAASALLLLRARLLRAAPP